MYDINTHIIEKCWQLSVSCREMWPMVDMGHYDVENDDDIYLY